MIFLQWFKTMIILEFGALLFLIANLDVTLVQVFYSLLPLVAFSIVLKISSSSSDCLTNFMFSIFNCSISFFGFSVSLLPSLDAIVVSQASSQN